MNKLFVTLSLLLITVVSVHADDGRTPLERFGVVSGIYSASDANGCSPLAMARTVEADRVYQSNSLVLIAGRYFTAGYYNELLRAQVGKAMDLFIARGDLDLAKRNVCVGLYQWGVKNAFSHPDGYLFFDPMVVTQFLSEELPTRTFLSFDEVVYHEFSHQLQFWYGGLFESDVSSRRSELTADCVAAVINSSLYRNRFGAALWSEARKGVLEAVRAIGDFEFENTDHHGTPDERYRAAEAGLEISEGRIAQLLSAEQVLRACESQVLRNF